MSSDEGECQLEYWNNWLPLMSSPFDGVKEKLCRTHCKKTVKVAFSFSKLSPVEKALRCSKFGNWIPPLNFSNADSDVKSPQQFQGEEEVEVSKAVEKNGTAYASVNRNVNLDWGERRQLHDVSLTTMKNGDLIWGVVHLGIFANIKVWVNEYGNICCLASGKISKLGSSEKTFICITDTQLLRKMLSISNSQWASLSETVKETTAVLKFDAFEDCDLKRKTSLERLWFFICKRRHLLPRLCMLLKFSGAVKCMREFNVTPKLLVQDIRNLSGEPIL